MIQLDLLKKVITKNKILDDKNLNAILEQIKNEKISLEQYLMDKHLATEEILYQATAEELKLPFVSLEKVKIDEKVLNLIPESIAVKHNLVCFDKTDKVLKIATLNPEDLQAFEFIRRTSDSKLEIYYTYPSSLKEGLAHYHKDIQAEFDNITRPAIEGSLEFEKMEKGKDGEESLRKLATELPIIKIVDTLLQYAIIEGASDIHIEPTEQEVLVRYRIDGILQDVMTLPKDTRDGIIARIKVLSNLKIDEKRLPQDGRFKVVEKGQKVSFRVSILPVYDGEKIVMRLLREGSQVVGLEKLGFQKEALEIIKRNIKKPHGMLLVTGPTGSGKTTTLYTILQQLNTPKVNISTIEDPIEYRMPRVNQSQINPKIGFTFAAGLRALLRQDPNIIMVGEIRDPETAEIAIHAAMTGHLVLSTLHTNDAVTTLPRLSDMGVPPFLVASTTNMIIAQRLVRKICPKCITTYNLDKKAVAELKKQFDVERIFKALAEAEYISSDETLEKMNFSKGKGCSYCHNSGYKGRIGVYEILEVTPQVSELILQKASKEQLETKAKEQGMITILEDGFIKVQQGVTTIEEILRVTKE
jgi:type IV pilus assembly protein PilB